MSVQHPVACAIGVTINTVYATLFAYYPLLEDVHILTVTSHVSLAVRTSRDIS
jgi:hypothetical protein